MDDQDPARPVRIRVHRRSSPPTSRSRFSEFEFRKRTPVKLIRFRFICEKPSLGGTKQKKKKKKKKKKNNRDDPCHLSYFFFSSSLTSEASFFQTFILYYNLITKKKKQKKTKKQKTQVDFSRGVRSQPSNYMYAVYAPVLRCSTRECWGAEVTRGLHCVLWETLNIALRGHRNKKKVDQATVSGLSCASDGPGIVLFDKKAGCRSREFHCFAARVSSTSWCCCCSKGFPLQWSGRKTSQLLPR